MWSSDYVLAWEDDESGGTEFHRSRSHFEARLRKAGIEMEKVFPKVLIVSNTRQHSSIKFLIPWCHTHDSCCAGMRIWSYLIAMQHAQVHGEVYTPMLASQHYSRLSCLQLVPHFKLLTAPTPWCHQLDKWPVSLFHPYHAQIIM